MRTAGKRRTDLAALLEHPDLHDTTLVGLSTGGGEVSRYVGRHGTGRVAQIVPRLGGAAVHAADRRQPRRHPGRSLRFFGGNRPDSHPSQGVRDSFWSQANQGGHHNAYEGIAAFSATDFRADLDKVDVPTLVIHVTTTRQCRSMSAAKKSSARIDGAVLAVYLHLVASPHPRRKDHSHERSHRSTRHPRPRPRAVDDPTQLDGRLADPEFDLLHEPVERRTPIGGLLTCGLRVAHHLRSPVRRTNSQTVLRKVTIRAPIVSPANQPTWEDSS